ncbi:TonB-dependent receptor [Gluconobacter frateurii M-2]|nr:TonB-dependent receptor [Gluconobacter frateurii M-2]
MIKNRFRIALLCSTVSVYGLGDHAEARKSSPAASHTAPASSPGNGHKSPVHQRQRDLEAHSDESVRVTASNFGGGVSNTTPGGGLMPVQTAPRSQSGITRDFIAKMSPTSNVQALISNLPGVVTASQDPIGVTGDQLTIRGMNQMQIGYVFEGVPIADPIRYAPYTSTVVDTENLGSVTVSQGSPDITAPLYNAVGGQITMSEVNPSHKMGGYLSLTGGTHSTNKEFLRFETGDIGNTGIRGFLSYSHSSWNNWRGMGGGVRHHTDEKFIKEWGEGNSVSALFSYNWMESNSYRRPSLAAWSQYGRSYNYPGTYTVGTAGYYDLNKGRNNAMTIAAPAHFTLRHDLHLNVTPYYMHMFGPSVWGQNVSSANSYFGTGPAGNLNLSNLTASGDATTQAVDPWNQKTSGINAALEWTKGSNTLTFGYWYSYTQHEELATFSPVDTSGNPVAAYGHDPIRVADGSILTPYDLNFKQQSNTLYLVDTLKLLHDRLSLTAGFKTTMLSRQGTNLVPGADPYKNAKNYFAPMPQFYVSYKLSDHDQVYINGTTAFRAPGSVQVYSQIFDPSSPVAVQQPGNLKPEYSIGEEIGYRHHGFYNFAVSAFNYNLTNHQVTSYGYVAGTNNLIAQPMNVGGQTIRGVQAELGLGNWHHFSPYFSGQYLHATTDNNFNAGSDYLPTKGKKAVQTPKFSGSIGLRYDDGHIFGNFNMVYVDSQYTTFMNDEAMHSYITSNMTLGYRMEKIGALKHPTLQLNLINLADNNYLSSPSSATGNAKATKGIYGNTVAGSSPIYIVGGGFAAMVSVSTGF